MLYSMTTTKATSIDDIRYEDLIDLRDLVELRDSLLARIPNPDADDANADTSDALDEDEWELLTELQRFDEDEFNGNLERDAENGPPTMVRYSYFTDYAQELAEDTGMVSSDNTMHGYIDWERFASDLQMDFQSVTFGGIEFFVGH